MAKPVQVTTQMVLEARAELKSLLAHHNDKNSTDWPIDTPKLRFYLLRAEKVPKPN